MAREIKRLTSQFVETVTAPGKHRDGENLVLIVEAGSAPGAVRKRWAWIGRVNGRRRELGLGSATRGGNGYLGLSEARKAAEKVRERVRRGEDPSISRASSQGTPTFEDFAEAYIKDQKGAWKNEVHAAQWPSSLKAYA